MLFIDIIPIMNTPDYKKTIQALNHIAEKEGGKVNYMKALKLLYFAERLHLREYGRLITDDELVAMKNGTLGSQAKDIVTKSEFLPHVVYKYAEDKLIKNGYDIEANYPEKDELSKSDIECIDKVVDILGNKDQYELAKLTHKLPEYKRYEFAINKGGVKVVSIDASDLFRSTDSEILQKVYSQSDDELDLSRELFSESQEHKLQLA